jgi:hypothetical protein
LHGGYERLGPINFAGFRIQAIDGGGMPEDELALAADFIDHRRGITGLGGRQFLPNDVAGVLVESDGDAILAARQADEAAAVNERMAREAPMGHGAIEQLGQIFVPDLLPFGRVQTHQVAHGAEGINLIAVHHGRAARSGGVANFIRTGIIVDPELFASLGVEAEHALGPLHARLREGRGGVFDLVAPDPIGDEDLALGDRRPRITLIDRLPPQDVRPGRREFLDDAGFAPDAIALGPQPLRPVVGSHGLRKETTQSRAEAHSPHHERRPPGDEIDAITIDAARGKMNERILRTA